LRTYLAASEDSFVMMPGGLSRVSGSADTMIASMQRGGGSKDTWVLSEEPVNTFSLLRPAGQPVELTRGGGDLPSRVADNLFWLGRYAERAEGLTRLLRGVLMRLTESSGWADAPEMPALFWAVTRVSEGLPGFIGDGSAARLAAPESELFAVIHDMGRNGSLASVLNALARVAGIVRDRISTDMWRVLNVLNKTRFDRAHLAPIENGASHEDDSDPFGRTLSDELDLLDRTVLTLAAFGGLAMESVTRGEGWRFLDMGRRLERCLHTTRLLRTTLVPVTTMDGPLLEALLEIADSSMTFRRRYQGSLQTAAVLDLLMVDETNPRSLAFQLAALADDVDHLTLPESNSGRTPEQRLMLTTLTALRVANVVALVEPNSEGRRPELDDLLGRVASALPELSDAITQTYLSHLQTSRHLASF
jgi:uncharacterized alpha-E superfamily protein